MIILAVTAALLPTGSAFAAKDPGSINLIIHNNTGGQVSFDLLDGGGVHHLYSLPAGQTVLSPGQGWYSYFAGLPCGNRSGQFNLNVGKQLYLSCGDGAGMVVRKTAGRFDNLYCYGIYDYWLFTGFEYAYMGDWCQGGPASLGETINYDVPRPIGDTIDDAVGIASYYNSGLDACAPEFGNGFYYNNCP